jgi:hypothetical protein
MNTAFWTHPEGNEFCICQIGAVPNDDNGHPAP